MPKPPAYMNFATATRPGIVLANPAMPLGEVDKALSAAWAKLSDAEKEGFKSIAVQAPAKKLRTASSASGEVDVASEHPLSAFMNFAKATRPRVVLASPTVSLGEVGKALGAAWAKLPGAEQEAFKSLEAEAEAESKPSVPVLRQLWAAISGSDQVLGVFGSRADASLCVCPTNYPYYRSNTETEGYFRKYFLPMGEGQCFIKVAEVADGGVTTQVRGKVWCVIELLE
jgi:hypothetical protein